MIRAGVVARWFVIPLALAAATACRPSPSTSTPGAPTADISGTVAAQVQATVLFKVNRFVHRTASAEKDTRSGTIASPGIALPAGATVAGLSHLEFGLVLPRRRGSSPVVGGGELWANRRFVQALCEQGGISPPHRSTLVKIKCEAGQASLSSTSANTIGDSHSEQWPPSPTDRQNN